MPISIKTINQMIIAGCLTLSTTQAINAGELHLSRGLYTDQSSIEFKTDYTELRYRASIAESLYTDSYLMLPDPEDNHDLIDMRLGFGTQFVKPVLQTHSFSASIGIGFILNVFDVRQSDLTDKSTKTGLNLHAEVEYRPIDRVGVRLAHSEIKHHSDDRSRYSTLGLSYQF